MKKRRRGDDGGRKEKVKRQEEIEATHSTKSKLLEPEPPGVRSPIFGGFDWWDLGPES